MVCMKRHEFQHSEAETRRGEMLWKHEEDLVQVCHWQRFSRARCRPRTHALYIVQSSTSEWTKNQLLAEFSQQPNCKNAFCPCHSPCWKLDPSWILQLGNRVQRCNALYVDVSGHGVCWSSLCALVSEYVMSHRSLLNKHIIYRHLRYFLFTNSFQYLYIHFLHCLIISLGLRFTVVCSFTSKSGKICETKEALGLCQGVANEAMSRRVSVFRSEAFEACFSAFFCIFGFTLSLFSWVSQCCTTSLLLKSIF